MWVFTTDGFYSAVEHKNDPSLVMVRARAKEDLANLRTRLAPTGVTLFIAHTPDGDYEWRMSLPRHLWARYLDTAVEAIDYLNFKDAVTHEQGWQRSSLYHDVWATMMQLQHVLPDDTREREARRG